MRLWRWRRGSRRSYYEPRGTAAAPAAGPSCSYSPRCSRRCDTLTTSDRVAGLLLPLYAQRIVNIVKLTVDHVRDDGSGSRSCWERAPVVLPEPLAFSVNSPSPAKVMPTSAAPTPHRGCSSPAVLDSPSATTGPGCACRTLGCAPARPDPPLSSPSPPRSRLRSSPACSASTSRSPSNGNVPQPGLDDLRRRRQPPDERLMRQAFRQCQYPTVPLPTLPDADETALDALSKIRNRAFLG